LNWRTEWEINSDYFSLERRYETEKSFENIGEILAEGHKSGPKDYEWNDFDIARDGIYYYRLRQYDHDGSFKYSKVIAVVVDRSEKEGAALYPNPADDRFTVEILAEHEGTVEIHIFDLQGRLVTAPWADQLPGKGYYRINRNISDLEEGVYHVSVSIGDKRTIKKLVILR
jgi:hypothetical protein